MSLQIFLRIRNALASGMASFFMLLVMALWIGGINNFEPIVSPFLVLFLGISFFAFLLGGFLKARQLMWSLLAGTLSGLAGGGAIILYVTSGI